MVGRVWSTIKKIYICIPSYIYIYILSVFLWLMVRGEVCMWVWHGYMDIYFFAVSGVHLAGKLEGRQGLSHLHDILDQLLD